MKSAMISGSFVPADCICAIFSRAEGENGQPIMLQLATVSGHPHWQASLAPTRRTSSFLPAICACAATHKVSANASAMLLLHLNMSLCNPHHFGASVLQLDLARYQRDQRTEEISVPK